MRKLFLFLLFIISILRSFGQWNYDTLTGGKMIILVKDHYGKSFAISDNNNGTIQVFERFLITDSGSYQATFIQRTDSTAKLLWGTPTEAKNVGNDSTYFRIPQLLDAKSDNSGGAYILYHSITPGTADSFSMYLQHINKEGIVLWQGKGTAVLTLPTYFFSPDFDYTPKGRINVEENGSIFVTWLYGASNYGELYSQKISNTGTKQWGENGILISSKCGVFLTTTDNSGGLLYVYEDGRNGIYDVNTGMFSKLSIYTQRLNATGIKSFGSAGVLAVGTIDDNMALQPENEINHSIQPDGSNGCYFIYAKVVTDNNRPKYLQKIDGNGQRPWGNLGVTATKQNSNHQLYLYNLYKKQNGGVTTVYSASRESEPGQINLWLQNFNADGTTQYTTDKKITTNGCGNLLFILYMFDVSFDNNGVTLFFFLGDGAAQKPKLQKMMPDGTLSWDSTGKTVISQKSERVQLINGIGTTTLQWFDSRNYPGSIFGSYDVFISRVNSNGDFPAARRTITSIAAGNWNNPATWQNGTVPGPDDIVVILHTIAVTANASCYSLSVQAEGKLTAQTGVNLSILH